MKLLVINPGSTSSKITLFENEQRLFEEDIFHDAPLLLKYKNVNDQMPFRKQVVLDVLSSHGYEINDVDIFIGRGGSAYPQKSGVIEIDKKLYDDTKAAVGGSEHPAKLGVMLAYELCTEFGGKMYTLNATNVDELCDYARITGIKGVYRNAQSHVLNQKAVAKFHSKKIGKRYEDCSFIVCHIDGGITVSAHSHGEMIDGNVGAGGDGSFTPTRIGSVPVLPLLDYIDKNGTDGVRRMCSRSGGFVSYFGTSNSDTIHELVEKGDEKACLLWNSMLYNICKEIGSMSAVLKGQVDGIILTGGLLRFKDIEETIKERCGWIANVTSYPGEMEQTELCYAVLDVLNGKEKANKYTGSAVFSGFDCLKE